jgi:hypothetical protein
MACAAIFHEFGQKDTRQMIQSHGVFLRLQPSLRRILVSDPRSSLESDEFDGSSTAIRLNSPELMRYYRRSKLGRIKCA